MEFVSNEKRKVTTEMRATLLAEFTTEDVTIAVKQMHLTKALSLDDMDPIFFQKFWDIVENDVTYIALQALNSGTFLTSLNHTYITLIPKRKILS